MQERPILAFDIGGSFVKAGLVNPVSGAVAGAVLRRPTPAGATPVDVIDLLGSMAGELPSDRAVGVAFPAVTRQGRALTAANIDPRWIGIDAQRLLSARIGRPVAFLNDADAAGLAEMTLGAGSGRSGTVMVLTLGTGIGTAIFVDGHLLPNTELGHLEVRGVEAEHRASAKVKTDLGLGWDEWAAAVNEVLAAYHRLLWPDVFVIGGGVTENWEMFGPLLESSAEIVPAHFRNEAGIIGAAMAAAALPPRDGGAGEQAA
jgi:polyphosphate glucokinase